MQLPGSLPIFGPTLPAVQSFAGVQASAWGPTAVSPGSTQSLMFMLTSMLQSVGELSAGWSGFAGGAGMPSSWGVPNQAAAYGAMGGFGFANTGGALGGALQLGGAFFGSAGYGAAPGYGFSQGYGAQQPYGTPGPFSYGAGYGGANGYAQPQYGSAQGAYLQGQVSLEVGFDPGQEQKMWDVWFDTTDGRETRQLSPIVLDLNKNGQADITGKNILGDGKLDGPLVHFDMDPDNIAYEIKSEQRRPGSGAPAVKGGHWVDADGQPAKKSPPKGVQKDYAGYRYLDKDGNVVGEMKDDGLYHYGKQEHRELTEWLAPDGGDGFLVWDYNGDGEIESAKELFGTVGLNGETFANGFEKLAYYFDKDGDGQVQGAELEGLQIWVDKNADGIVDEGEMQSLAEHGITSFDVSSYNGDTMEGSYRVGGGAPTFSLSGQFGFGYFGQPYPAQPPYTFAPAPYFGAYGAPSPGGGYAASSYG